ncbi:MAG: hypothetical protein IT464_04555 [Planctomycetes bacterium]|nr:hypothetical protein [Planctomycetota bacterium]
MDQPFEASIANVRLAVKLLREAALSPIPDLDEVAPDQFEGFGDWAPFPSYPKKTGKKRADEKAISEWERKRDEVAQEIGAWDRKHSWSERARSRTKDAFDWRDELTKLIGTTSIKNRRPRHPDWDDERLAAELGYRVINSAQTEIDDGWGPPETLLGEFYEQDEFGTSGQHDLHVPVKYADIVKVLVAAELVEPGAIKVNTERTQPQAFWEISPHFSRNDDARAFLGPPPRHLTDALSYMRVDRRVWSAPTNRCLEGDEFIHPFKWWQYAEVILQQCLLERTRALELCAWCDQRIEAWQSAFYPTIIIGPEIVEPHKSTGKPKATGRRHLRVMMAGTLAPDSPDTIIASLARDLLLIRDGMGAPVPLPNADPQIDKIGKVIPLLRQFLVRDGALGYRLPMGMTVGPRGTTGRIRESESWPPQTQE